MVLIFFLVFSSLLLVFYIINILELIDNVIENKIPFFYVLKYDFYATPEIVTIILPISILTAVLLTFSLMSKNNEVIAVQVSGISLLRLALPAVFLGLFLSLAVFFIQENILPEANRQSAQDAGRDPQAQVASPTWNSPATGCWAATTRSIFTIIMKSATGVSSTSTSSTWTGNSGCSGASPPVSAVWQAENTLLLREGFVQEFPGQFPRRQPPFKQLRLQIAREPEVLSPKK